MKKLLLFAGILMIAVISLSSCRKCITCKAYDRSTGVQVDESEYCGMKRIVDQNEDSYKLIWDDTYTRATCN